MSAEYLTVVTRKGQITIPAPVRRALGLEEGDQVALVVKEDQQVYIARPTGVVARTAGIFKGAGPKLSVDELRREAEEGFADGGSD